MRTAAADFGRVRGEHLGEPAAPTPPSGGLFHIPPTATLRSALLVGNARLCRAVGPSSPGRAAPTLVGRGKGRKTALTRASFSGAIVGCGLVRRVLLASPRGYCA